MGNYFISEDIEKGRGKKGYNSQEVFISLIKELDKDYKMKVSNKFLLDLTKENTDLTNRQKTHKLNKLSKGINKQRHYQIYKDLQTYVMMNPMMDYPTIESGMYK